MKYVKKTWGHEEWLVNNEKYCCKRLFINKKQSGSYHFHKIKDETFYIEKGRVLLYVEGNIHVLQKGDTFRLPPLTKHRFGGLEKSVIVEVSTHHDDNDTYRLKW